MSSDNDDDDWGDDSPSSLIDEKLPTPQSKMFSNFDMEEQRKKLLEKTSRTNFASIQDVASFNTRLNISSTTTDGGGDDSSSSSEDKNWDDIEAEDEKHSSNHKPSTTTTTTTTTINNNNNTIMEKKSSSTTTADKILQNYQTNSKLDDQLEEEMIQQKSTLTKRLIQPNRFFKYSISFVCTLFGIICGFIISNFTVHSTGFILIIILLSILLIGLGLWFGATETIEERVTVTQVKLPSNNNLLYQKAVNFWKSSECQTLIQQEDANLSKSYVNKETRDRFADKEEDEIFDSDITIIGKKLTGTHEVENFDFSDDESSNDDNDDDRGNNSSFDNKDYQKSVNVNNSSSTPHQPKPIFVDVKASVNHNSRMHFPIRKVKRNGEKDHLYYGASIPSYWNGKWIPPYSDTFETFKHDFEGSSNVLLRDESVGQRNSILPNIRLKNDEDYRSSKTFTEIEMDNIKNNVNQHREELYNFGVDNTHYEPVIAPPKIRDLCKIRKLVLKFE